MDLTREPQQALDISLKEPMGIDYNKKSSPSLISNLMTSKLYDVDVS